MNPAKNPFASVVDRLKTQLPYLPQAFGLVWQASGRLTLCWFGLILAQGLLPIVSVYLTRQLVNGVAGLLGKGGGLQTLQPLLPAAIAMVLVLLGIELLQSLAKLLRTAQSELVQDRVQSLIHAQALRLDLSFFDNPEYYDQLHRARIDAVNRPTALLENVGALLQSLITLLGMGWVLLAYGAWIPLILAMSTAPALLVVLRHTVKYHRWRLRNTAAIRRATYYDLLLTQREAAAEMRLFGLGSHFRQLFQQLRERLRHEQVQLARSEAVANAMAVLFGLAGLAGALFLMGRQALRGLISLGDLALFYQAFFQGQRLMRSLLGSAGEIYRNLAFLENLFQFLELQPALQTAAAVRSLSAEPAGEIVFRDVSFTYEGASHRALHDFSMTLPAGSVTAVVGHNGAGKSTLIKLLCRLYDPQQGTVLFDGIDLRELDPEELRRRITVLFQEPVHYHASVTENITMGRLDADQEAIHAAALAAGADGPIQRLSHGYETVLGKWFGGAELSVGEWQRLALARAFLRDAPVIVLDEPTSAMDSWAEADWLDRFRDMTRGHTVLMITHRFTTAMHADRILLMDEGRVVESGSHAELVALGGQYAVSWRHQMKELGHAEA